MNQSKNNRFFNFCEDLFKKWTLKTEVYTEFDKSFDMEALYEPYLLINLDEDCDINIEEILRDPLYVLTTNPGGTMSELQLEEGFKHFLSEKGRSLENITYQEVAALLGREYQTRKDIPNATRRIKKMIYLAKKLGKTGIIQIECIPFHSKKLDAKIKKRFALKYIKHNIYTEYLSLVKDILKDSATVGTQSFGDNNTDSEWLCLIKELMDLKNNEKISLKVLNGKTTIYKMVNKEQNKPFKALTLVQGNNNFPSNENLDKLF